MSRRVWIYLLAAAVGTAVATVTAPFGWISVAAKAALAVGGIAVLALLGRGNLWRGDPLSPWALTALIPLGFQWAMTGAPFAALGASPTLWLTLAGVTVTALWEETVFRGIALAATESDGEVPARAVVLTALVFGAAHLTTALTAPLATALTQAVFAAVQGAFWMGLTRRTRSLLPVLVTHWLMNAMIAAYGAVSVAAPLDTTWMLALQIAVTAALAVWLNGKKKQPL